MLQRPRINNRRRGVAVVETALVLSVLMALILGVFEYGRIVMLRQLMQNAAREGARLAVVGTAQIPVTTTQAIVNKVNDSLAGQAIDNVSVQVFHADAATGQNVGSWDLASYGEPIIVKIEADYTPILPVSLGIVPSPIHFTMVSMMLSEAN